MNKENSFGSDFRKAPEECIKTEIKEIDGMIAKLSQSAQKLDAMSQQQQDEQLVHMLQESIKDLQSHRQKLLITKESLKGVKTDFISF